MTKKNYWLKSFTTLFIIWTFLLSSISINGQDIVSSRDISGGSSVFTFPKSRKSRQSKFRSTKTRSVRKTRTVASRKSSRRRISRQYNNLAKVKTRVNRIEVIDPITLPQTKRETPERASEVFVGVGQYYINEENIEEAIKYFRQAVDLNKENEDAVLGLSDVLVKKGDKYLDENKYLNAKRQYTEAISFNAENSAAYVGLGEIYAESDDPDQAIENYEKAVSIDPDLTEAYAPLGILYFQKGRIADADTYLTKALAADPNESETQYFLGLVRFTQNQNEGALIAFQKAADADPTNAEPQYYIGETLERLGRDDEAIVAFQKATQINPKYSDAWFSLGVAYYNGDNFQKSVDAYAEALKYNNTNAEAYVNQGDAYRQLAELSDNTKERYSRFQKSNSAYSLAVTFIENNPTIAEDFTEEEKDEIYNKFGYVAGQLNILAGLQGIRHNWDRAIGILTKTTEVNPSAIDYVNLGWAYYNAARIDLKPNPDKARETLLKAKTNLEKAISMNPDTIVLHAAQLNLGITLIDLRDFSGAVNNLKSVTSSRKDWAFASYALGVAYLKSKSYKDAIAQFENAIRLENDYVQAYSGLGNSYLETNDKKNVQKVIEKLVRLGTPAAITEAGNLKTALNLKGFTRN